MAIPKSREFHYVYYAEAGPNGPVKIGYTTNPLERIKTLQTGCPAKISLLGILPSYSAQDEESRLHQRFKDFQLNGEWFSPHEEIFTTIARTTILPSYVTDGEVTPEQAAFIRGRNSGRNREAERWRKVLLKLADSQSMTLEEVCHITGLGLYEVLDA